jgi:hypothetical protein
LAEQAEQYAEEWQVPAGAFREMKETVEAFDKAYRKTRDSRCTRPQLAKKTSAREAAEAAIRQAVSWYIRGNPLVMLEHRIVCGLPVPSHSRMRAKDPTMVPVLVEARHTTLARLRIRTKDSESYKRTKPEYVYAIEVAYTVGREREEHVSKMTRTLLSTRTTFDVQLSDEECTMYFSFRMRYVNTRGRKGPWSEAYHVVVA